jgi:plasmid stabilization system protein ParE
VTLPVRITPEVDSQIRQIDDWWRKNRSAAADLFLNELAESFELIAAAPQIGRLYRRSPVPNTRRLLLTATRYHIYYVHAIDEVRVLAIWHARRGAGPPLRIP